MRKRAFLVLVLIVGLLSLLWLASSQSTASRSLTKTDPSTAPSMPSKEAVSAKLADLERGWVKNEGQWDQRALFSAPGYFGTTWITKDGELLHVAVKKEECKEKACPSKGWVISERWVGGKVQAIKGEEELETKVSYFIGNDPSKHKSGLSTYRYVSLGEVWSGVEVQLKATQKTVEKLFYVKPGADPSKIVVQVDGAEGLKLSKDGEIIIQTGLGDLKLSKPIAWQEKDGKKLPVEVSYKLIGKNRYSFEVAKADPSLPIVIDPILQSTYLGGRGHDRALALATHPTTGEVYVAGYTFSTNFPNTTGGAQGSKSGIYSWDAFVARLNSSLTQILQSTYLGGRYDDRALALAIHPTTGDVYVSGWTSSDNFPRTTGGAQGSRGGSLDAFVARLNSNLTQILQSTYLGGSGTDYACALAISGGEVYVAGWTSSDNFPRTAGGAQGSRGGSSDAFVARLDSSLTSISQSTYLGGSGSDSAIALAISGGDVYVVGYTYSTNFPRATGGAQASYSGRGDAFVARLTADLAAASSYTLSISPTPTNGNVTSSPPGINCSSGGSTCSASFISGSTVTLTATPDSGYTFRGWAGDCSGCGANLTCTITVNSPKTCSVNFTAIEGGGDGGSGGGSGGDSGSNGESGGGGGYYMTGSASSMAGVWNILAWLSVPAFALARRIRRR